MTPLSYIVEGVALFAAGAGFCYALFWFRRRSYRKLQHLEADALLQKARSDSDALLREAQASANLQGQKLLEQIENSFAERKLEQQKLENRLSEREKLINSQLLQIVDTERWVKEQQELLRTRAQALENQAIELKDLTQQAREQLQKQAGLTDQQAHDLLLKKVEQESQKEATAIARRILDDAKAQAEDKAKRIVAAAVQRYAGDHTFENTTATIALQGDDIKGRIIGREGRNIRAFEAATGVTVLIDDTPGAVLLSGFDPVRREIAREAMTRLIQDGRIHPTRIEEVVNKVKSEMEENIVRLGEDAATKTGIPPLHIEILKLLGRLHFRNSYSQNLLSHSVEVAHLMGLMAAEMGLDVTLAKRAGLLHDIGKAVTHEIEGPHAVVGAELIKRYGEPEAVVNGVASHHNDVPANGPLGPLVSAADAISASRPGARSETMTTYLKRVEDLEKLAATIPGVEKAFALQAGRELRVFVDPGKVGDDTAYSLARTLAGRIENELQYPGQIRVTVIRETRCVELAK